MKKVIKSVALLSIMIMAVAFLAGCGNKLVATKTTDDEYMGKYDEKIEIKFKNDKADEVKMTYTFDNEDSAKSLASMYSLLGGDEIKVDQKGKSVVMTMSAEDFGGTGEDAMTKDEIKASLEEQGYTVK